MSAQEKSADGYEVVWRDYGVKHKVVPADAIVIERGALPAVVKKGENQVACGDVVADDSDRSDWYRARGLFYLALAEHLDANPPVDQAEVQRLQYLITSQPGWTVSGARLAYDLYLAGLRAPEVTP